MRLKVKHSTRKEVLQAYGADASLFFSTPSLVIWPEDEGEVVEAVEYCLEEHIPITPRGAGTGLVGGAVALEGAVIDTSHLWHMDLNKKVFGSGVRIRELNTALKRKYGEILPVIPSSEEVCTFGGAIAANAGGLRSFRYGRMERWVEWVKFVDGRGKIRKTRDFVGCEGIFGLCIEAKVKTCVDPEMESLDVMPIEKGLESIEELRENEEVVMLELIGKRAAQLAECEPVVLVGYRNEIGKFKGEAMASWLSLRKGLHAAMVRAGRFFTEDPFVPLEKIKQLIRFLEDHDVPVFGHIGAGVLHPAFSHGEDRLRGEMYALVLELGGDVSGEHGYGLKKWRFLPKEKRKRLLRLKKKYDPEGLFNPGKVIDGPKKPLDELAVEECTFCGLCHTCPVYSTTWKECHSPRVKGLLGLFPYACSLCKWCTLVCPVSVDMEERIIRARHALIKKGVEQESNKKMIRNIRKFGNPFGESAEGEWYCC